MVRNQDIKNLIFELFDSKWTRDISEEEIDHIFAQDNVYYFVHKENDMIVGMIVLYIVDLLSRKVGVIEETVVLQEYRNKGIASKLISTVIDKAIELGVTCIELNVKENKKNVQNLYKKFGFYDRTNIAMRKWINKR